MSGPSKQTRNLKNGSLNVADGQTAANTLVIPIDMGDVEWDYTRAANIVKARGKLNNWTKGKDVPVRVKFTCLFAEYASKTTAAVVAAAAGGAVTDISVRDFLTGRGAGGVLLTSSSGRAVPFTTTLNFHIANPLLTGEAPETITFTKFHVDKIKFQEGEQSNSLSVEGTALVVRPTSVRT